MRKVVRQPLSEESRKHLEGRQVRIDAENDPISRKQRAAKLWDRKRKSKAGEKAFSQVTEVLQSMCNAPGRCMYCEDSAGCDIEHVKPKSEYPEVTFHWENYLWTCSICNSRYKGGQYHDDFMDPSAPGFELWQRWRFDAWTGHYRAVRENDEGARATLGILGFDVRVDLADWRKDHLRRVIWAIRQYGREKAKGREEGAREIASDLCSHFPAIVEWLLVQDVSLAEVPPEIRKGLEDVRKVRERFPEIVQDVFGE